MGIMGPSTSSVLLQFTFCSGHAILCCTVRCIRTRSSYQAHSSTLRIGEQQASGSGLRWPAAACYAWPTGEASTGKIKIYPAFGAKPEKAAQVVASNLRLGSSKSRTASDASCRVEVSRGARRVGRALAGRKWQPREQLSYKRLIALCGLFFFLIHMAHGKGYARCAVA